MRFQSVPATRLFDRLFTLFSRRKYDIHQIHRLKYNSLKLCVQAEASICVKVVEQLFQIMMRSPNITDTTGRASASVPLETARVSAQRKKER